MDPEFFRYHQQIRALDAEAARAGRVAQDLSQIRARLAGAERPRAAQQQADAARTRHAQLTQATERALTQLRRDRGGLAPRSGSNDATRAEARALRQAWRDVGRRLRDLRERLRHAQPPGAAIEAPIAGADEQLAAVDSRLAADQALANTLSSQAVRMRQALVDAASKAGQASLQRLADRMAAGLRRAQIGTIDAVMGSKRRIERQIESLAAGRFPPDLVDPLRNQGLLRDDEEYWPFEGEHWEDEFNEGGTRAEAPGDDDAGSDRDDLPAEDSEGRVMRIRNQHHPVATGLLTLAGLSLTALGSAEDRGSQTRLSRFQDPTQEHQVPSPDGDEPSMPGQPGGVAVPPGAPRPRRRRGPPRPSGSLAALAHGARRLGRGTPARKPLNCWKGSSARNPRPHRKWPMPCCGWRSCTGKQRARPTCSNLPPGRQLSRPTADPNPGLTTAKPWRATTGC